MPDPAYSKDQAPGAHAVDLEGPGVRPSSTEARAARSNLVRAQSAEVIQFLRGRPAVQLHPDDGSTTPTPATTPGPTASPAPAVAPGGGESATAEYSSTMTVNPAQSGGSGSGSGLQVDPAQAAALDSAVTEFAASQQPSGDPNEFTAEWQRQFRGRWDGYAPHDESFLQDFLHQWSQAAANWTAQHAGELQQGGNAAFGDHILQTMRQQAHGSDAEMALSFLTSTLQTALTNTRAVKDLQSQATQFASDHWYLVVALAGGALGYGLQQGLGNDNWSPMARISGLAGQLPMFKVFDSGDFQLRLGLTSSSPIPGEAQDVPTIGIAPGMSATGDLGHGWRAGLGANTNLRIAPDVQQLMAQFNLQPSISYSRRVGDAQVDLSFSGAVGIGSGPVQGEGRFQLSISFGHSSRDD